MIFLKYFSQVTVQTTDTALVEMVNDLRLRKDSNNASLLPLLDLSAVHTVDHKMILHHLENCVGLSTMALRWFQTNLQEDNF